MYRNEGFACESSSLSKWLKWIIVVVGLCGLLVYVWVIPSLGKMLLSEHPEFAYCYLPWMIGLDYGVPCYVVLVLDGGLPETSVWTALFSLKTQNC
jgi:hypothetical protein